jgi:hypothetical protein
MLVAIILVICGSAIMLWAGVWWYSARQKSASSWNQASFWHEQRDQFRATWHLDSAGSTGNSCFLAANLNLLGILVFAGGLVLGLIRYFGPNTLLPPAVLAGLGFGQLWLSLSWCSKLRREYHDAKLPYNGSVGDIYMRWDFAREHMGDAGAKARGIRFWDAMSMLGIAQMYRTVGGAMLAGGVVWGTIVLYL